jgi:hypothetical protein
MRGADNARPRDKKRTHALFFQFFLAVARIKDNNGILRFLSGPSRGTPDSKTQGNENHTPMGMDNDSSIEQKQ